MKKIFFTIVLLCTFFANAQSPILNLHTAEFAAIENAYYKDIDNFYNQFVGTWAYTNANKTIRFKFIKKVMFYRQSAINCYVDYLVGEMQYIDGGVEKINSLSNLNINHISIHDYNLTSYGKVGPNWFPTCLECPANMQRLVMSYDEPTNDAMGLDADFIMRIVTENNIQKLKIQYAFKSGSLGINKNNPELLSIKENFTIPYGDYTLVKEN